jgi:YD repeat-containing protein
MTYRGNLTSSGVPGFPQTTVAYDVTGMPVSATQGGTTTTVSSYDAKNMAPTLITTGSLSMSTQYNQVYEVLQSTGPNGATTTAAYDTAARPVTETAATGAVVSYSYSLVAPQVTATVNGRWTKSYLDGLGRAVKVETGNGGTVISTVESVYGPCGCSPMGKVMQTSLPYAPGGTKYSTVYTYDAAGRAVNVALPNGAGSTMTAYQGNKTTVTSPASKWKAQTVDAAGNLTRVTEPNPGGGTDWYTDYVYNDRNLLLTVTMTRPTGTQVRSYTYNNAGQVLTATNPENGTVTSTYSGTTGLTAQKLDAKGNTVTYIYDTLKRPTEIHRWEGATEQADQLVKLVSANRSEPLTGTERSWTPPSNR